MNDNYYVFAGDRYYLLGGWSDLRAVTDSMEEAMEFLAGNQYDWWQIVHNGAAVKSHY